jgi:hypothetical protein
MITNTMAKKNINSSQNILPFNKDSSALFDNTPEESRILYFRINEWKTDVYVRATFHYDVDLTVFDDKGNALAKNSVSGIEPFDADNAKRSSLSVAYADIVETLLNKPNIISALSKNKIAPINGNLLKVTKCRTEPSSTYSLSNKINKYKHLTEHEPTHLEIPDKITYGDFIPISITFDMPLSSGDILEVLVDEKLNSAYKVTPKEDSKLYAFSGRVRSKDGLISIKTSRLDGRVETVKHNLTITHPGRAPSDGNRDNTFKCRTKSNQLKAIFTNNMAHNSFIDEVVIHHDRGSIVIDMTPHVTGHTGKDHAGYIEIGMDYILQNTQLSSRLREQ